MKKLKVLALGIVLLTYFGCKTKKEVNGSTDGSKTTSKKINKDAQAHTIKFALEPKSESNVRGEVSFTEANGNVKMTAILSGLTPGIHAIHIHEKADCSSADGKSAGGHWNPTFSAHGKWGAAEGYHKGDIGNFTADAQGNGKVEFATNEWCIGCGDGTKDIVGKGIIVHQGTDDYVTQPTGDAGGRVSCAGIIQ